MKKLWTKTKQSAAWLGSVLLAAFAFIGAIVLFRKRPPPRNRSLEEIFEREQKLAAMQQEVQDVSYELQVEKAKNSAKERASALQHDPDALAAALTKLSND